MPRFRLTVAYDGSAYSGWQRQDPPTGEVIRTVQATLEEVVSRVVGEPVVVHGASRTDAGVHAKGQAARQMLDQARVMCLTLIRTTTKRAVGTIDRYCTQS